LKVNVAIRCPGLTTFLTHDDSGVSAHLNDWPVYVYVPVTASAGTAPPNAVAANTAKAVIFMVELLALTIPALAVSKRLRIDPLQML
jgi:hypothetical protein